MRRVGWVAGLALSVAACAPTSQERVREYNEDAVHLFEEGSYAHARDTFRAALALRPGDPDLLYNLGRCYDRLGDATQARLYYEACLKQAPNHAEGRHALTVLLVSQGRRDEARQIVEEWLRRAPNRAGPYAEDGWLREQEGDLLNARGRLQQALAKDPHDNRALTELGRVYEALHRPDRAVVLYERALEYHPHQPELAQRVSLLRAQGAGRPHPD
jgi:tetratricopeptide (TPR) repeat protein